MIYILLLVFCFVFYPRTSPAPSIIRLTCNTSDSRQMGLVLRFKNSVEVIRNITGPITYKAKTNIGKINEVIINLIQSPMY